jgi:hypothetical protein
LLGESIHRVLDRGFHFAIDSVDVSLVVDSLWVVVDVNRIQQLGADLRGQRTCVGIVSIVRPKGTPSTIGSLEPRSFFFSPLTRSSPSAIQRPSEITNAVSCPPTVATGTIGTPERIAVRTKPLRPPSTASSRLRQLRIASTSPPGQMITSHPALSAAETPSREAGITPATRK